MDVDTDDGDELVGPDELAELCRSRGQRFVNGATAAYCPRLTSRSRHCPSGHFARCVIGQRSPAERSTPPRTRPNERKTMQDQLFQMNAHGDTWQEPQLGDAPMIGDPTPAGAPADALERIAETRAVDEVATKLPQGSRCGIHGHSTEHGRCWECDGLTAPHVATKIEPGAILYSSWGYDQTNIDFYYVTRATAKTAWIIPMANVMTDVVGWASEHVVAGEPLWFQGWCECKHRNSAHDTEYGCRGAYGDECDCRELRPVPNVPEMHRIRRWSYGDTEHESLTLTSYSSASLWEGRKLYASHYA